MAVAVAKDKDQRQTSWQDLLSADWSDIDPADIERFADWAPQLSETVQLAASSALIGAGKAVGDPGRALKLLGAGRVRHVALWQRMRELFGPGGDGAAECATVAAAAYVVAKAAGLPPYGAITSGFAARLGQRLLVPDPADQAVLGSLLEQAHPAQREQLEERLFGTTALQALEDATGEWSLPRDLKELLNPVRFSPARRLIDDALTLMVTGQPQGKLSEVEQVSRQLGEILQVLGVPWKPPPVPEPRDVLLMLADVRDEAAESAEAVEAKERQIVLFRDLLDLRDAELQSDILRPVQRATNLDVEVSRAIRYKRKFSVVGVRLDPRRALLPELRAHEILADMARMLRKATRSADHVGFLDGTTLLIVLPETDLGGARLFAERVHRGLSAARRSGHPKVLVYCTSLEQEPEPKPDALVRRLMLGLQRMGEDPRKVRFAWNDARASMFRVK